MILLRRILREPLFQFLVIGALVFAAYSAVQDRSIASAPETIEVGPGRIAQLTETFSRTWQRPPTQSELNGLIDAFVKEEVFYREGRKLGLDRDDTVFRRRLQQKMEFLIEPSAADLTPSEEELQTYLDANAEVFRIPAQLAFRQIFFDLDKRGDTAPADAKALLETLGAGDQSINLDELGDPTLLPPGMPLTPVDRIAVSFGSEFADALGQAETGKWAGPVRSTFGEHLVMIDEQVPGRAPDLDEVRRSVLREWEAKRRREIADSRYQSLRDKYDISVTVPSPDSTAEQ